MSTLRELKDQWTLAMAATYHDGPLKGKRVFEYDIKHAQATNRLGVQIQELERAEQTRPQISQAQLDQLNWLQRARGAKDKDGRPLVFDMSQRGNEYRRNLDHVQQRIEAGENIGDVIAKTEADMAARGVTLPPAAATTSVHVNALQHQPIVTERTPVPAGA